MHASTMYLSSSRASTQGTSDRTVKAALNSAKGQARYAVVDARGSGLTEDQAHRGIRRLSGTPHGNRLDAVLIIGDNYNIDWQRAASHVTADIHLRQLSGTGPRPDAPS
jgi:Contact-dependent growth inhibition CdiA C-terminal domain